MGSHFSKLKSGYTKKGKNNIEKAYDDLILGNKKIDDVFYKNVNKVLSDKKKEYFSRSEKFV